MNGIEDEADYLVLGAGLAGLTVAHRLGDRALVLEREARPGGLVRSECVNGYWFDHAVHLLYFANPTTKAFVENLLGVQLAPCPPVASVETSAGISRYPIQSHLASLQPEVVAACLADFRAVIEAAPIEPVTDYEAFLLNSFGRALCELFFFPYNRKLWKRPLKSLAPAGFQWNIAHPSYADLLRGATTEHAVSRAYNASGFYPRPPYGSPIRGIEVLSRALAASVPRVELETRVVAIDPSSRTVTALRRGSLVRYRYRKGVCATLPLPILVELCAGAPQTLITACQQLRQNRVRSVCVAVEGERPPNQEHWRYYPDETICFHRLVYPHQFDPMNAPETGFGILAELTEPAENAMASAAELVERVIGDLFRVGAVPQAARVVGVRVVDLEPAYVVFGVGQQEIVARATQYLGERAVRTVGRYARWEYSSMAQVIDEGFELAAELLSAGEGG